MTSTKRHGLMDVFGRTIDRFAFAISPRWGCARLAWRNHASYDSGGWDNDGWIASNQHGAIQDRNARDRIRAFARDLERNSDIEESVILAFVRNVVGLGFKLQSHVRDTNGNEDENTNRILESLWEDHCRARNFDIQGRQSLTEMLQMAERRLRVDGGVLFVKCFTPGGVVPLCWQMREVDELDSTIAMQQRGDNYIVDGIEVDQYGKRVAYWFRRYAPDGFQLLESERIPADRVIFLEKFKRVSQPREISPFSTSIQRMRQTDGYLADVTKQARVASRFAIFLKSLLPLGGMVGRSSRAVAATSDSELNRKEIPSGLIIRGQPGDEAQAINPPQIGSSPGDLTAIGQRLCASSQGLSYEAGSRDYSKVNFASGRLGQDGDIDTYKMEQMYIIEHALYEMYTSFVVSCALAGLVPFTATQLFADKARYFRHEFIGRGWPWSQPVQEANANKTALETGQKTLLEIHAQKGLDWRDAIAQRKLEIEAMREAGIVNDAGTANAGIAKNGGDTNATE